MNLDLEGQSHFQCFIPSLAVTLCLVLLEKSMGYLECNARELTDALLTLSGAPHVIDGGVLHTIERFVDWHM